MPILDTLPGGFRDLQIEGALEIYGRRRMVLADQPGSGKTLQALLALEIDQAFDRPGYHTLILCNVTGCQLTWSPELRRRVVDQYPNVLFTDLTASSGKTMPSVAKRGAQLTADTILAAEQGMPHVVLANYDLVRAKTGANGGPICPPMFGVKWNAVVIDESHLVLPDANSDPKKVTQFTNGILHLPMAEGQPLKLAMTGTPDRGKLENRFGHWRWLMPQQYNDFWQWANQNFHLEKIKIGYNPATKRDKTATIVGQLRSQAAWDAYSAHHMLRRTKAEMLEGLPEKQWANGGAVDLPMTPLQAEAYDRFLDGLARDAEELERSGETDKAAGLKLQATIRGRQLACSGSWNPEQTDTGEHWHANVAGKLWSNKLTWLVDEFLSPRGYLPDNYDASLGKVVVVSFLVEELRWLKAELEEIGVHAEILAGDTPGDEKARIQGAFQNGSLRVILLSGSLGVAIDLDAADDMVMVDLIHDPDRIEQAEDRIHRASRIHQVTYWRLVSQDTVDEAIIEKIDKRYWVTRERYDGSRGIQFARKFLTKGI